MITSSAPSTSRLDQLAIASRFPTVVALTGLLLFASCTSESSLRTQLSDSNTASTGPEVGLHYFLPRGKIRMTGTNEKSDAGNSFKITTSRLIAPDRSQLCFLKYHRSLFHDDDFTLEVDDNGLVKTVNSTSTDQSPAIVESLTETAVNLLKIGAQLGGRQAQPGATPRPFIYTFDPLNEKERREAISFLEGMGISLKVDTAAGTETDKGALFRTSTLSTDGVLYHPPLVVTLRFSIGTDSKDSAVHVLPNPAITKCLSLRRASLVRQETQLAFSNGMLTHVKFTRPSQALAAVQIPQKITQKVAEAIPQIIKIQNDAATRDLQNKTAILQAQQNYLQAQMDLRRKEAELKSLLEKTHAQEGDSAIGEPTARVSGGNDNAPAATPAPTSAQARENQSEPASTPNEQ